MNDDDEMAMNYSLIPRYLFYIVMLFKHDDGPDMRRVFLSGPP